MPLSPGINGEDSKSIGSVGGRRNLNAVNPRGGGPGSRSSQKGGNQGHDALERQIQAELNHRRLN